MNTEIDVLLFRLLNSKVLIIVGALIFPLIAGPMLGDMYEAEPFSVYMILAVGFIIGIFVLKKVLKFPIIPYLSLQLILFLVFLDKKIEALIGMSFKLYMLAFGLSALFAILYLLKDFEYFWKNFPAFRYLFIFVIFNIFYVLFYHSDFRTWYSTYMDTVLYYMHSNSKFFALSQGVDLLKKDFNEPQYVIYLVSLAPLISFIAPLIAFYKLKTQEELKEKLVMLIKYISIGTAAYYILAVLCLFAGLSNVSFLSDGRLWGDILGVMGGFAIYLSLSLLLFLGFKYYVLSLESHPDKHLINTLCDFIIFFNLALIFLQIGKASIIVLGAGLITFFVMNKIAGINNNLFKNVDRNVVIAMTAIPLLIFAGLIVTHIDLISDTLSNLLIRFSSNSTFETREMLWNSFINDWQETLTPVKLLFGYGIDAARENAHFVGFMLAVQERFSFQHVHNLYITMFYDYGLIALFYFGPIIHASLTNIKYAFSKKANKTVKLFSNISLTITIAFLIFFHTEILKIPIAIIFFAMLGFFEAVKYAFMNLQEKNGKLQ